MLKDSWGEQLSGHFSFGLIFAVLSIPIVLIIVFSFQYGQAAAIAEVAAGIILMIAMGVVQWSLQSILMGALYLFVRGEKMPSTFSLSQIPNTVT